MRAAPATDEVVPAADEVVPAADEVLDVPLGRLTEAHYEKAARILKSFDVVLALPAGASFDTGPLRARRGWPAADPAARWNKHSDHAKKMALGHGDGPTYKARLALYRNFSHFDRRLLALAEILAKRPQKRSAYRPRRDPRAKPAAAARGGTRRRS